MFFFKQKTAYEMRISDWSSDVCSSDLLAAEGAPFGIRVVAISPGVIDTPGTADLMNDPDARAALLGRNLVQRIGIPEDIIPLAMLLASDEGAYVTGSNFVVDGGRLAH